MFFVYDGIEYCDMRLNNTYKFHIAAHFVAKSSHKERYTLNQRTRINSFWQRGVGFQFPEKTAIVYLLCYVPLKEK